MTQYQPQAINKDTIQQELYAMLAYRLGRQVAGIAGHLSLAEDLYVDSLDLMEIEIGVAETFGVEIQESERLTMQTVDDLAQIIVARIIAHQANLV